MVRLKKRRRDQERAGQQTGRPSKQFILCCARESANVRRRHRDSFPFSLQNHIIVSPNRKSFAAPDVFGVEA